MQLSRVRHKHRRLVAAVAVLAVSGALLVGPGLAAANPPPNPTNGQITSAAQAKQALATEVGQLSGQVAQAQSQLQQLQDQSELAQQKYDYAAQLLVQAKAAAAAAQRAINKADQGVKAAQQEFVSYVQATYMNGSGGDTAGALLTAQDPNSLLQQSTLQDYQASHQISAIGNLQRALVGRSNADAAAKVAVAKQAAATTAAATAKQNAIAAAQSAQQQTQTLETSLAANQTKLQTAQLTLATLNHERATFLAYQHEQAVLAAKRRAAQLAAERAAQRAAARRAQLAAEQAAQNPGGSGDGGGTSGGSGSSGSSAPAPSGGSWTPAAGLQAVARALSELGVPYAWDGGNRYGPTLGQCSPENGAPNDCHVTGFDCSGLALYAWDASWDHYTVNQVNEAGSHHPSLKNALPGDLIFYSFGGPQGVHHVAIYMGHDEIVQAPYSGAWVTTSSVFEPGAIYEITRPHT